MKLYSYWRSTTSYRVRAALNLKGLSYDIHPVDLVTGEQHATHYANLNPNEAVPTLELEDGTTLTQSLAIIDYLDAIADPKLLPEEPLQRARIMAAAHTVALDIHPVNNLRVVKYLTAQSEIEGKSWMCHWMKKGFDAVEKMVDPNAQFAFSGQPDLADICIVAQLYNAHRWGVDLAPYPNLRRIEQACLTVPEIMAAHPDNQPEAKT